MFTGIITDIGEVVEKTVRGDVRFRIATSYPVESIDLGASVACSGVCLTVVERGMDGNRGWLAFDASAETLDRTILKNWAVGSRVNLERALKVGDELGGHIVSGHVDGVAEVISATPENASVRWRFRAPDALAPFIAPKGSVALDGVSLTVNEVDGATFGVNIIPHTAAMTGFGTLQPGDRVNIEIDTLARYVARMLEFRA